MTTVDIKWLPDAVKDLEGLDNSVRIRILKAIHKLKADPTRGDPLGEKHQSNLTNFRKLEVGGYRVVYFVYKNHICVLVIAVGKRGKERVYKIAGQRIKELRQKTDEELAKLSDLLQELPG